MIALPMLRVYFPFLIAPLSPILRLSRAVSSSPSVLSVPSMAKSLPPLSLVSRAISFFASFALSAVNPSPVGAP